MSDANLSTGELVLPVERTEGEVLEARITGNAYNNIFPARYLRKDADGDLVETQEGLFLRAAKSIVLTEAVFEAEKRDIELTVTPNLIKPDHPHRDELAAEAFGKGVMVDDDEAETTLPVYNANKFVYNTLVPELPEEVREVVAEKRGTFEELMEQLSFMPNSPTLMSAGDELQQPSACFVDSSTDDITDMHQMAKEIVEVFQSGGGMDHIFWKLRPYGDAVGSTGGIASDPITFIRTLGQTCETIAQGDARRGVQMGVMRVSHPDAIQFPHVKGKDVSLAHTLHLSDPDDFAHARFVDALDEAHELIDEGGRVPKHLHDAVEGHSLSFDISAGITDGFVKALYNGKELVLTSPRTKEPHIAISQTKEIYDMLGLGEHVEAGEMLSVPAKELWDQIIKGAWENDESGVVYLECANKEHSFDVEKHLGHRILATNPCGEQPLEEYETYNPGYINLSTSVAEDPPDWRVWYDAHSDEHDSLEATTEAFLEDAVDWEEFGHHIESGMRFLENVVTVSDFPVEKIEEKIRELREIRLGIMGLAQLYIQLGVRCGPDEGNEIVQQLMIHINHGSKRAPRELAEECDPFRAWEDSKYTSPTEYREWFKHHAGEDVDDWGDGYPIRNHNMTIIAPTGTTLMVSNTTDGCKPIYSVVYYKNVSDDVQGDEMLVELDGYFLRVLEANDIDVEAVKQEAQEQMANNQFDGLSSLSMVPDVISELFVVTPDLAGIEHAGVQCALQSGVDSAISKTCNFPNSVSKEDMDEVYRYIYDHGGKGVTVYRGGTRSKQMLITRARNTEFPDDEETAEAIVSQIRDAFGNVEVFLDSEEVSDLIGSELELAFVDSPSDVGKKCPRPDMLYGVTQRIDTGHGKLYVNTNEDEHDGPFELSASIGNSGGLTAPFIEALAKAVSTLLRSGVGPEETVNELKGIRSPKVAWDKGKQISSAPDAIGTVMRWYFDGDTDKGYPQQQNLTEVGAEAAAAEDANVDTDGGVAVDDGLDNDVVADLLVAGKSLERLECGEMDLHYSEGYKTCQNCGWSEC